jgi:hypothetical protein
MVAQKSEASNRGQSTILGTGRLKLAGVLAKVKPSKMEGERKPEESHEYCYTGGKRQAVFWDFSWRASDKEPKKRSSLGKCVGSSERLWQHGRIGGSIR